MQQDREHFHGTYRAVELKKNLGSLNIREEWEFKQLPTVRLQKVERENLF